MRPGQANRRVEGVDGLAALLQRAGVEFAAEDLADALWLAGQMGEIEAQAADSEPEPPQVQPEIREEFIEGENDLDEAESQLPLTLPPKPTGKDSEAQPREGLSIQAPAAPALRIKLDLARALRPLRRMVPAPGPGLFDEAATVVQIAEQNIWSPVMTAAPERWLDLALVVEDSASLVLWRETIREFQSLVERQGAFRRVTTWRLGNLDGNGAGQKQRPKLGLFANWAVKPKRGSKPRQAEQLLDPAGRRLILLLSDCTSAAWHSGAMLDWLETWSQRSPMAMVQFLPERLWAQTALGRGLPVWLRGLEPGLTAGQLRVQSKLPVLQQLLALAEAETGASGQRRNDRITVPVVTLEAEPIKQWAKVVAGWGEQRAVGVVLEREAFSQTALSQAALSGESEASGNEALTGPSTGPSPEERVQRFRGTASLVAQRLAGLMAAVPVDPVVVDLIRQTLLREAEPVHVAEVYMGGLMEASGDEAGDGELRYDFPLRVRELLVDGVPRSQTLAVLDAVSAYISERLRLSTRSFEALLCSDWAALEGEGEGMVAPFARVAAGTLARLGGEYAGLARRVQTGTGGVGLPPTVEEEPEDLFPLLQSFRFREATLTFDPVFEGGEFDISEEIEAAVVRTEIPGIPHYSQGIAIISDTETEQPLCCGFLISERYLVTCGYELQRQSQVGQTAKRQNTFNVFFPMADSWPQVARRIHLDGLGERWRNNDVALLKLENSLADSIPPLPLLEIRTNLDKNYQVWGVNLRLFDYLIDGSATNILEPVQAAVGDGPQDDLLALRTVSLGMGFSGAPLWDATQRVVVGMVLTASEQRQLREPLAVRAEQLSLLLEAVQSSRGQEYELEPFGFETASVSIEPIEEKKVSFSVALKFLETSLAEQEGALTSLTIPQKRILRGAWNGGQSYAEIAKRLEIDTKTLRTIATDLWNALSQTWRVTVTQTSFRRILTQRLPLNGQKVVKITRIQTRGRQFRETLAKGIELTMVRVPAGTFVMGSPEDELNRQDNEGPQHEVTIAEPFLMGQYPVTQAQWQAVAEMPQVKRRMEQNPSRFKEDDRPVEDVSWLDAVEFCARLGQQTGREFRLPTEAEWEYACRAKSKKPFSFGETLTSDLANYDSNYTYGPGVQGKYRNKTTPVGQFPANGFGLYDMHGNVWEWCKDLWCSSYQKASEDGSAWLIAEEEERRVLRGGSWDSFPEACRSASRVWDAPNGRNFSIGFRIVCDFARW